MPDSVLSRVCDSEKVRVVSVIGNFAVRERETFIKYKTGAQGIFFFFFYRCL